MIYLKTHSAGSAVVLLQANPIEQEVTGREQHHRSPWVLGHDSRIPPWQDEGRVLVEGVAHTLEQVEKIQGGAHGGNDGSGGQWQVAEGRRNRGEQARVLDQVAEALDLLDLKLQLERVHSARRSVLGQCHQPVQNGIGLHVVHVRMLSSFGTEQNVRAADLRSFVVLVFEIMTHKELHTNEGVRNRRKEKM
jgi:hypothetical protein